MEISTKIKGINSKVKKCQKFCVLFLVQEDVQSYVNSQQVAADTEKFK